KIKHPSEYVKVGDELDVLVLELDVDNRRLALGHKQLEENPWDTFENIFPAGSVHKCTVVSKNDKCAVLELPYGLEGFANSKNFDLVDGFVYGVIVALEFNVSEFSKDEKRIVRIHTATFREDASVKSKRSGTRKLPSISATDSGAENSPLGD